MQQNFIRFVFRALFALVLLFGFSSFAFASSYSDLNNNGIADADENIVVASTTMSLPAGEYHFHNLTITSGTQITAEGNPDSSDTFKGVKIVADNLTLEPNSHLSADGQGYVTGPGAGTYGDVAASYGGVGGGNVGTSVYGSATHPVDLGSGAGSYRGGGAIIIVVTGTLVDDGCISANGGSYYRTSGGSIYVATHNFAGTGTLSANGLGSAWPYHTGGGGGRIAVYYDQSSFSGNASANAGIYCFYGCNPAGALGTVVFFDTTNNDAYPKSSFVFQKNDEPFNFHNISIINEASTKVEDGVNIVAGSINLQNRSQLSVGNNVALNVRELSASNNSTISLNDTPILEIPSIVIGQGSTLTFLSGNALNAGTIAVQDGGTITTANRKVLSLNVSNLTVSAGSSISANLGGFGQLTGPGAPPMYSQGASYGGVGYLNTATSTYGSDTEPTDFGSGGGAQRTIGGGAIRIISSGTLINNGTISANGGSTSSGGSVYVTANTLDGSGTFSANGGNLGFGSYFSGPGGGGRVAIYYNNSTFTGVAKAPGGCGSYDGWSSVCADNGTVVTKQLTPPCATNCYSNVLFLPGIEASRLYRPDYNGGTDQLWEPNSDSDVNDLSLDDQGKSVREDIYTKDIMDEAYAPIGPNIYSSFISEMNDLKKAGTIKDWSADPYDWRLSLDDILSSGNEFTGGRIYYAGPLSATSTPYILQELHRLASTSKSKKVTIIAHSNGGLVAKALMQALGATTTASLIDKVIMVDVPQVGTPEAIGALLHGEDQSIPLKTSDSAMRALGNHSPAVYNLLPSTNYFTYIDDPVVTFDPITMPDWIQKYGDIIHSTARLHPFLGDSYGRVISGSTDTRDPTQLSDTLLTKAENVHALLDSWTPPAGVKVIQIAGWGIPTTLKGIEYAKDSHGFLSYTASTTIDGDGTVVTPSSLWMSATTPGVENYWMDLKAYNKDHPFSTLGGLLKVKHENILEVDGLRNFISDSITDTVKPLSDYSYLSTQAPASAESRLRYELHSPLTLDLYDDQGRHTGVATSTGAIEEQIPGTYYMKYGEVKYLFTNSDIPTHIVMSGYATSTFTFKVEELQGDTSIGHTTFQDIPVTPNTKVTLDAVSDITTLSSMHVDENGNGSINLTPKLGGVVYFDTTPPTTTAVTTGQLGLNGWYTSATTVTLTAVDNAGGVGVEKTMYSLDGGTWLTYATTSPIAISSDGAHSIQYYSVDYAGNTEPTSTLQVDIDTAIPAISSSTVNQQYLLNSPPLQLVYYASSTACGPSNVSATLDGAKIISPATLNFDQSQIGNHTIMITAQNVAGTVASSTIKYNVAYSFGGFLDPIKSDGSGVYKLGRTLPIKFQLTDANHSSVSTASARLVVTSVSGGKVGTSPIDLTVSTNDSGNLFRYTGGQYIYNFNTGQLTAGAWQVKVVLNDGSSYGVMISLR